MLNAEQYVVDLDFEPSDSLVQLMKNFAFRGELSSSFFLLVQGHQDSPIFGIRTLRE